MITYKYSFWQDLKLFLHNRKNEKQLEENRVVFIYFSLSKYLKLLVDFHRGKIDLPRLNLRENIVCYIVSSGTWGAYESPNKIFICPLEIDKLFCSMKELIVHEIVHLRLEKRLRGESFEERERIVDEETDRILKSGQI